MFLSFSSSILITKLMSTKKLKVYLHLFGQEGLDLFTWSLAGGYFLLMIVVHFFNLPFESQTTPSEIKGNCFLSVFIVHTQRRTGKPFIF